MQFLDKERLNDNFLSIIVEAAIAKDERQKRKNDSKKML